MKYHLQIPASGGIEAIELVETDRNDSYPVILNGHRNKDWGQDYNQNIVDVASNFSRYSEAPPNPFIGQMWFDAASQSTMIFLDSGLWKPINEFATGATINIRGHVTGSSTLYGDGDEVIIDTTMQVVNTNPGTYLSANITVDQYGRVISAVTGIAGDDGTTEVNSVSFRNPSNVTQPAKIGDVVVTGADIIHALGFTPYNAANPNNWGAQPNLDPYLLLNGSRPMTGHLNMNNNRITNLAAPTATTHAARKADVDAVANNKTRRIFQGQTTLEYNVTVSTSAPTGGSNGDEWYRY